MIQPKVDGSPAIQLDDPGQFGQSLGGALMTVGSLLAPYAKGVPKPTPTPKNTIPNEATQVLKHIDNTGVAPPGYKGGRIFQNRELKLPSQDAQGNSITYKEYDINPYQKGVNRGAERIVSGSDGSAYYTSDHYGSFTQMK
jgi:guanyl-specific ribonuclease Sa